MVPTLRPLSTGELLDTTFSLYRRNFLLFVGIVALPNLVLLPFELLNISFSAPGATSVSLVLLNGLAIVILTLAVTAASQGATLIAVSEVYLGRTSTVLGALSRIRGEVINLAVLMIAMGVATGIGLLLLVIPGIYIALRLSLAIPVAVLEQETIGGALSRSGDLTEGSKLRILVIYVLFLLLTWVIILAFAMPLGIVAAVLGFAGRPAAYMPGWLQVLNVVASFLGRCLTGPFLTIGIAVLYYDVRVRKEALDLELMMKALDGGAPGQGPAQVEG